MIFIQSFNYYHNIKTTYFICSIKAHFWENDMFFYSKCIITKFIKTIS